VGRKTTALDIADVKGAALPKRKQIPLNLERSSRFFHFPAILTGEMKLSSPKGLPFESRQVLGVFLSRLRRRPRPWPWMNAKAPRHIGMAGVPLSAATPNLKGKVGVPLSAAKNRSAGCH
jgi:hypothetical protein